MKTVYQIDPVHSNIQFSVRHMMVSNVRGNFTGLTGKVVYDPDNLSASTVHAEIDAATINTFDASRDAHLKGADFLDVEHYPNITFESTKVEKDGDGLKLTGNLTIHGITKPATLKVEEIAPEAKDPWGNTRAGASVKGKVNRTDFGLAWNTALETGGFLVGDDVKFDFEIQLVKAQTTAA